MNDVTSSERRYIDPAGLSRDFWSLGVFLYSIEPRHSNSTDESQSGLRVFGSSCERTAMEGKRARQDERLRTDSKRGRTGGSMFGEMHILLHTGNGGLLRRVDAGSQRCLIRYCQTRL